MSRGVLDGWQWLGQRARSVDSVRSRPQGRGLHADASGCRRPANDRTTAGNDKIAEAGAIEQFHRQSAMEAPIFALSVRMVRPPTGHTDIKAQQPSCKRRKLMLGIMARVSSCPSASA